MQHSDILHRPHRGSSVPPPAVWLRLNSQRAGQSVAPALARPNLFAGD